MLVCAPRRSAIPTNVVNLAVQDPGGWVKRVESAEWAAVSQKGRRGTVLRTDRDKRGGQARGERWRRAWTAWNSRVSMKSSASSPCGGGRGVRP